jgi:hypothetical protein
MDFSIRPVTFARGLEEEFPEGLDFLCAQRAKREILSPAALFSKIRGADPFAFFTFVTHTAARACEFPKVNYPAFALSFSLARSFWLTRLRFLSCLWTRRRRQEKRHLCRAPPHLRLLRFAQTHKRQEPKLPPGLDLTTSQCAVSVSVCSKANLHALL